MDKKKIKSKIEEIIFYITTEFPPSDTLITMKHLAEDAIKELSKSDWVPVEDELPPYDEVVLVCCSQFPSDVWLCKRTNSTTIFKDYREFMILDVRKEHPITHWCKIDKLEE